MLIENVIEDKRLISSFDLKAILQELISQKGGWVNCHSHLDRAYTISSDNFSLTAATLQEKWQLVDSIKEASTVTGIYDRMCQALEEMIKQGVFAVGSFLDADEVVKDKALKAAEKIKEKYKNQIVIKFISHASKGAINKNHLSYLKEAWDFCDIIGGLPGYDKGQEEEHLDQLFTVAKKQNKILDIHVDQLNTSKEKESEQVALKTKQYGMQGKVVLVHGISMAAHKKPYRQKLYKLLKDQKIIVVACPTAWIDSRRSEELVPNHNSIAPVDELTPFGIPVALGTDNIADIYKPFSDGDLWTELRVLLESCHFYDIEELSNIATINGRKALGINIES